MIELIIWLAALLCPNPTHTIQNHENCNQLHVSTTTTENFEGGETGGVPKPPPPPPPPGG
ncbi:MAG: hypothetical protein ABIW38_00045 [Ferruginibacter sp.]